MIAKENQRHAETDLTHNKETFQVDKLKDF